MALYRTLQLSFWTDPKVDDDFTPEDKYFYLYLLTNPHTNICGCYEVGMKQMSKETGYNDDSIRRLLDRMENEHQVIEYCKSTKEVFIPNWHKYNWSSSKDTLRGILKVAENIKSSHLKKKVLDIVASYDESLRPPIDPLQASVTVTITNTDNNINSISSIYKEIINYLNISINSNYKYTSNKTQALIKARLNDGFTLDDFKMVIDKKAAEWFGTDMEKFLRPETLFGTKFESYLNQKNVKRAKTDFFTELEKC